MAKCPVGEGYSGVGAVQRRSRDRKIGFIACKRQCSTDTDSIRREPSDGNIDTIRRIPTVEAILRTMPLRQPAGRCFGFSTLAPKRRVRSEALLCLAAGTIPANIRATAILPYRPTNPTSKIISPATENHNGLPEKLKAKIRARRQQTASPTAIIGSAAPAADAIAAADRTIPHRHKNLAQDPDRVF